MVDLTLYLFNHLINCPLQKHCILHVTIIALILLNIHIFLIGQNFPLTIQQCIHPGKYPYQKPLAVSEMACCFLPTAYDLELSISRTCFVILCSENILIFASFTEQSHHCSRLYKVSAHILLIMKAPLICSTKKQAYAISDIRTFHYLAVPAQTGFLLLG